MLRRFAPGYERPAPDEARELVIRCPFSRDGVSNHPEATEIIREFFDHPLATISAMIISRRTLIKPFRVLDMCRLMASMDILEESPPLSGCFRLSSDLRVQTWLEQINAHTSCGHRKKTA